MTDQIIQPRLRLPDTCVNPHGLGIDSQQQVAFIACIDSQNVVMVDLRSMKAIGDLQHLKSVGFKPDIVALDSKLHILYVGCASGISVFDESGASRGSLNREHHRSGCVHRASVRSGGLSSIGSEASRPVCSSVTFSNTAHHLPIQ